MKIVYYTTPDFLDSDISLLREYQRMGHELMVFVTLAPHCLRGSLVDIKRLKPVDDVVPFAEYREMDIFSGYVDLKDFYFINRKKSSVLRIGYLKTMRKMAGMIKRFDPDVIHSTIPLDTLDNILLRFRKRLVVTFHDPFLHSGKNSRRERIFRGLTLKTVDKIVILNQRQKDDFIKANKLDEERVMVNRLSHYDVLSHFGKDISNQKKKQIIFFGKIASYKGLEYLCEAMVEVHKTHPELELLIAGGGKIYFDYTPYEKLPYIRLVNRYIAVDELARMIGESEFAVCPYKDATQSGVVMTAFAMRCPVLATDAGALGHQIEDSVTGALIPTPDAGILARAICRLHSDGESLEWMRRNIDSRNNAESNRWRTIASDYIEFYKRK